MKTKDFSLTVRVPYEAYEQLTNMARNNNTTISEISRDTLLKFIAEFNFNDEHEFLSRAAWSKAIRKRDNNICQKCKVKDSNSQAHHIIPIYQGGKNILSNGVTLCPNCHRKTHTTPENLSQSAEYLWNKKYKYWIISKINKTEIDFYKEQIGCFYTKRKRGNSPVVQNYIKEHLQDKKLHELKKILFSICPNPDIIKNFKSRVYSQPALDVPIRRQL